MTSVDRVTVTRVVFDTNVLVDAVLQDYQSGEAVRTAKRLSHHLLLCERLLREYHGVFGRQFGWSVDRWLMQALPIGLIEKVDDPPKISIQFGPVEDRFHMQLAIDWKAGYHVTRESAILNEAANMMSYGVKEAHPAQYARDFKRKRG